MQEFVRAWTKNKLNLNLFYTKYNHTFHFELKNNLSAVLEKLKKIVQESLTGLNNEKIIQKLDKIRDCVAKEKGVIISSKSLAEWLSHSIVFPKQGSIKIAPKPFWEIETVEVNDKLTSKIERINSIPFTNEQFSSIEMNSSKLKFQRYQTSRGVNSEVEQEFNTENNMWKPKIMKKLPTFATTLSNLKNQIN